MGVSFFKTRKSGLKAAFLLLLTSLLCGNLLFAQEPALNWRGRAIEKISQSPIWRALLHSDGLSSAISDPEFVLSGRKFSPQNELIDTLNFLYDGNANHVCRFPARYVWLKTQLDLPGLSLSSCSDLNEFLEKAPSQQISLIFASESLAQPASMMGHSFLKLSGKTSDGREVSHAITFFTEAEGYNLPKLFIESTVLGKPGFFALSPFDEELNRYLKKEQRKVWFYGLDLDGATRQLIQYHLQELKQTKLVYLFQSYNCATLLRYVLALSGKLNPPGKFWVSPKNVVQDAMAAGLVDKMSVDSPNAWLVRVISEKMPSQTRDEITQAVLQGNVAELKFDPNKDSDYLRYSLAQAYTDYRLTEQANNSFLVKTASTLAELRLYPEKQLQIAAALNPANSPPDSQMSISTVGTDKHQQYRFSFLPASHWLIDNNDTYTQETELQLMGLTAYVDQNQRLGVERLTLYKMQSYTPFSALTGGLSSKLLIQWGTNPYQAPDASKAWTLSGAVGRTYRLSDDIDVFGLIGFGLGMTASVNNLPLTSEVGAIIREIASMKTVVSYERRYDVLQQSIVRDQLQLEQVHYLTLNVTLFGRLRKSLTEPIRFTEWEVGLKRLF